LKVLRSVRRKVEDQDEGRNMALNVKNPEAEKLAKALAR